MTMLTFQAPPRRSIHFWVAAAEECETAMQVRLLGYLFARVRRAKKVF